MKTLYDKDGNPRTFTHAVDARAALESGALKPYPPGYVVPVPKENQVEYELLQNSDIVELAKVKHGANLDVNNKKELLIAQLNELDNSGKVSKESPVVEDNEDVEDNEVDDDNEEVPVLKPRKKKK